MLRTRIYHLMTLHVTYLYQTLELTVMSINFCSIVILYATYLAKMLCMVRLRNKICSKTGPK